MNALTSATGEIVLVDWTGTGWGPCLWPLAYLLWAAGQHSPRCVDAVIAGYGSYRALRPDELERLPAVIAARPLVLAAWSVATGREPLADVAARLRTSQAATARIADRAR